MGSAVAHAAVIALVALVGLMKFGGERIGDPNPGGSGVALVEVVDRIPLPKREAPENPLANDSKSEIPQSKPEPPKQEREDPDAVALEDPKRKPPKDRQTTAAAKVERPRNPDTIPNPAGAAASSPLYGKVGPGGVGVGENSVLGTRFGAYADLLRRRVSEKWQRQGLRPGPAQAIVEFDLARDGRVSSVRLKQAGGYLLDRSAQRAVLDVGQFPPFPAGLTASSIRIEFIFEVKQ
jgi:TonB family protein